MRSTAVRMLASAVLAASALGMSACGNDDKTSSGPSATTSETSTAADVASSELAKYLKPPTDLVVSDPLRKKPSAGKKVVFLSNGIEIAQQISAGLEAASKVLGWHYSTLTVDQNNPATVGSNLLAAINDGADAVFVSATPSAIFQPALAEAKKKGTAIIDISSGNQATEGITALVNNASNNGPIWGRILALGALAEAEKSGDTAKIVLVTSPIFKTILGPTDRAAEQTVSKMCPDCSYDTLSIAANRLFTGKGPSDVVSYLQRHPDVKYVLQDSSLTDQGLVPALKSAGLTDIKIYGVAPLKPQVDAVKAGDEQGWVVDPLQVLGWMGVDAAARAFTGGDPTVYDKVGVPSYLLTKDNAAGPTEAPEDYRRQFNEMWQVG